MRLLRYVCGCDSWKNPCYQRGNSHYIALPETPEDNHFVLNVTSFDQKGRKIHLGGKEANVLDFLCHVPQVEDHVLQEDFSTKLLSKQGYPRYQRRLDIPRAKSYGNWWADSGASSVNAVVLAVAESYSLPGNKIDGCPMVKTEEGGDGNFERITIDDSWLDYKCPQCDRNVKDQLERIINGTDYTQPEKDSAQAVYNEVIEWLAATEGFSWDCLKTFYCLDRHCASTGQRYHQSDGIAGPEAKHPFDIIDGQHRIKGSQKEGALKQQKTGYCTHVDCVQRDTNGDPLVDEHGAAVKGKHVRACENAGHIPEYYPAACFEKISFSLVSKDGGFADDFHGRLFTEITTEAKKLAPEHQFYMHWRYSISNSKPDLFASGNADSPPPMVAANGNFDFTEGKLSDLVYRVVLRLNATGFLRGRLRPIGPTRISTDEYYKQYYIAGMKRYWEWIYTVIHDYFNELRTLDAEKGTWTKQRYTATNDADILAISNVISLYIQAWEEEFMAADQWNPISTTGTISGEKLIDGSGDNNAFGFQVIAHLLPTVMKEVAMDNYFVGNPTADAATIQAMPVPQWKIFDPSTATLDMIKTAIRPLGDFTLGKDDGMHHRMVGRATGWKMVEILAPFIVKPISDDSELPDVIVEVNDIVGAGQ